MRSRPLDPIALLRTLTERGVDFVLIGGLAVGIHAAVRPTGDVDVMVPAGDERNRKALERALRELDAELVSTEPAEDDEYPTLEFLTRYGKLDVLYRPDGARRYAQIKDQAVKVAVGSESMAVVGRDDLIEMKLAAGRPADFEDVTSVTDADALDRHRVSLVLRASEDRGRALDLVTERVRLFDRDAVVRLVGGEICVEASRGGLALKDVETWAKALGQRLYGAGALFGPEVDLTVD